MRGILPSGAGCIEGGRETDKRDIAAEAELTLRPNGLQSQKFGVGRSWARCARLVAGLYAVVLIGEPADRRVWLSHRESPASEGFGHGIFYAPKTRVVEQPRYGARHVLQHPAAPAE